MIGFSELRTIGVSLDNYKKSCKENKIDLFVYDIVEMGPPPDSP